MTIDSTSSRGEGIVGPFGVRLAHAVLIEQPGEPSRVSARYRSLATHFGFIYWHGEAFCTGRLRGSARRAIRTH